MGCDTAIAAPVYNGYDNELRLILFNAGQALADLSGLTRVTVSPGGAAAVIDSDTAPGAIRWSDQESYRGQAVDVLTLKLGGEGLPAGVYEGVELVIYDAVYINGLKLETPLKLTVFD